MLPFTGTMNIEPGNQRPSASPSRPRRRVPGAEPESVSVVVVEAAELASSCLPHLRGETGVSTNWLYCRWRDERFASFADRALRRLLCREGQQVSKITYFFGHDETIESERLALLASYMRALPPDGTLLLVAPELQQSSVLSALAVLHADNARKVRIGVSFVSRPALGLEGQRAPSRWTKITGAALGA